MSPMAKAISKRSTLPPYTDSRTEPITRRLFHLLLQEGGVEKNEILKPFEVDLSKMSEADAKIVREASDKMKRVICSNEKSRIDCVVKDFEDRQWAVSFANLNSEFHRVVDATFKDNVNWGRIVMFTSFAVSFAVYALKLGLPSNTALSIHRWTVETFTRTTGDFLTKNNGWEGFIACADVLLKIPSTRPDTSGANNHRGERESPLWQSAVAVGALGVGAMLAFTVRQALS